MDSLFANEILDQNNKMVQYYRFHSKIYDATRWTFLFGRKSILKEVQPYLKSTKGSILEIGCGTGTNLIELAIMFPRYKIIGIDVSKHMVEIAKERTSQFPNIEIRLEPFSENITQGGNSNSKFDMVLFSYSITMMDNLGLLWIDYAKQNLKLGGVLSIVDFYHTRFNWFENWMKKNHVQMCSNWLEKTLNAKQFDIRKKKIDHAYLGLWKYGKFVAINM
jgi:S-adenosylmethionine-diacylgycerolhomoserine-N-methlytransferase